MSWARAAYRSRQLFAALRPRLAADDRLLVAEHLPPELQRLFHSMALRDRRHAVDVARVLLTGGETGGPLVQAALLHDVGKGLLRLWQRVIFVVVQAASPRLLACLVPPGVGGWRAPFDRLLRHGELGARLLEESGASAETVRLVQYHDDRHVQDGALARLRAADDRC